MDFGAMLEAIVELLGGGISGMATAIGSGVQDIVTNLAVTGTGSTATISTFVAFVAIFGGIGLAVGLTTKLFMWIRSLGAK